MPIDILNIQPQVISRDLRTKFILLAGAPKIGKTEFCSLAPDALILAFEIGTNARPGALVQKIASWSDFKLVLRQLERDEVKAKYSTIAIDTIGIAYDLCEQFICNTNGVKKIGDIPYGAGYKLLSNEFSESLRKITMMDYGLIMTCHLKEAYDDNGNLSAARPDLNDRCLKIVNGLVDVIGVITQTWDDKGNSQRWIQTRASKNVAAGTRYRFMEAKIPFGYKEFVDALGKAIDLEEANGATVVEHDIKSTESLNFESVRNRAQELWYMIVGQGDTANAAKAAEILLKIESIMGHKMKLSDFTESQVEMLNLVVLEMEDMI